MRRVSAWVATSSTRAPARGAALALALALALPAPAPAYDLLQAWRDAQSNDAPLAAARAVLAAAAERVPQARAGLLPQVGAAASYTRTHAEIVPTGVPLVVRNFSGTSLALNLTQPILRLQNVETLEQSRLALAQAEAAAAAAELDLMVRVSQAYFDVLAAQDVLFTIRAQKRAIAEQLESAKRSFEVGTATVTDQQEAQARFDLATAQQAAAENQLAVSRSALQLLVGRAPDALRTLGGDVGLIAPEPADDAAWVAAARQSNYAVQQLQAASEIARREIRKARFAEYPTLDLVGSLGRSLSASAQFIGTRSNSASIGVQLNVPIYAGGALEARVRETGALLARADADLENGRRQAEQAARTAYLGVASGLAQVRALEAGERSSRLALDSNLLGYQVGVRINIDVLNAQQQLFATRRDLARARYDTLVNGLRLKSAASLLAETDLAVVNALLTDAPPEPELSLRPPGPVPLQGAAGRGSAAAGDSTGSGTVGVPGATVPGATTAGSSASRSGAAMPGPAMPGTAMPAITAPAASTPAAAIPGRTGSGRAGSGRRSRMRATAP